MIHSFINKHTALGIVIVLLTSLHSCVSDVDLKNIDTRVHAEMGVAIPVGDMLFTTNDFLGGGQVSSIVVDQWGIFHFIDSTEIPVKTFHDIDLSSYVGQCDKRFLVYDQLQEKGLITPQGYVVGNDVPITLNFPLTLKLEGLNTNIKDERIDSVQVTMARFTSVVNVEDLGLQWRWIDRVDLVLNEQFRRPKGNIVPLYVRDEELTTYDYGDSIPIFVDEFTVSFLNNLPGEEIQLDDILNTCGFEFLFTFTIPKSQQVAISQTSAFKYGFETQFIDFDAAWGDFAASNQMRDSNTICIQKLWDTWGSLKKMNLHFREPSITIHASHQIAAPLRVYVDQIMVSNSEGETAYAQWGSSISTDFALENFLAPDSPLEDSVWNEHLFNHEPNNGHLDNLFRIRPDSINYKFHVTIDNTRKDYTDKYDQHRITNNTKIHGMAVFDLPFMLDTASEIEYRTKVEDVQFNRIQLDSLLSSVKVLEKTEVNHIILYMILQNSLPFEVQAKAQFLLQDSTPANIHLFEGQTENIIQLPAPKMKAGTAGNPYGEVVEPSETIVIAHVDKQQFDSLTACRHLRLDAYMGNNPEPCVINTDCSIQLHLGVAASVDAIMNFNKKNQQPYE